MIKVVSNLLGFIMTVKYYKNYDICQGMGRTPTRVLVTHVAAGKHICSSCNAHGLSMP